MDVVSACYFTGGADSQRGGHRWPKQGPEADALVEVWHRSVGRCGLHAVVLYDDVAPEFRERWSFPWFEWVQAPSDRRFGIYDARWPAREWLIRERPDVEHWCFTDISDVEFYGSPFELMRQAPGHLWLSSETIPFEQSGWMLGNWLVSFGAERDMPTGPLYNAGLFGGEACIVREFVELVIAELTRAHERWKRSPTPITYGWFGEHGLDVRTPLGRLTYTWLRKLTEMWERDGMSCEMSAVNAAARRFLDARGLGTAYAREVQCRYNVDVSRLVTTGCIATGFPWHTRFKHFEPRESGCAVRHK